MKKETLIMLPDDFQPQRIMFVGDTHGDPYYARVIVKERLEKEQPDAIFQLGDFAYKFASKFLNVWAESPVPVFFINGNHDDTNWLKAKGVWKAPSFVPVATNVFYVPNGYRWEWNGLRFAAMGGAHSIDGPHRVYGESRWEDAEMIAADDHERVLADGRADVFLTHDFPYGVPKMEAYCERSNHTWAAEEVFASRQFRLHLRTIFDVLNPQVLFHGHMHVTYEDILGETRIFGFCHSGSGESVYTYDFNAKILR